MHKIQVQNSRDNIRNSEIDKLNFWFINQHTNSKRNGEMVKPASEETTWTLRMNLVTATAMGSRTKVMLILQMGTHRRVLYSTICGCRKNWQRAPPRAIVRCCLRPHQLAPQHADHLHRRHDSSHNDASDQRRPPARDGAAAAAACVRDRKSVV